ncbi:hypothetical protein L3Y34_009382 [Caenorhabditis briggsae]|uniref:Nuclear receptor domain-containing protein n=1 Tax=Caenorhabditis briggsae TaxID=6238 RepID=A0AAE9ABY5_CAEBR|nr:hypothetical protein L3Y34_009382 [Caenorhabditis briggsae]
MTSVPSTSSTSAPPTSSGSFCAVCGDVVHSRQYGVPSCLGCVIFFRRSVINKSQYKCWKNGKCVIDYESRCSCRACRLRKCFHVGMEPRGVQGNYETV